VQSATETVQDEVVDPVADTATDSVSEVSDSATSAVEEVPVVGEPVASAVDDTTDTVTGVAGDLLGGS
jgi:hypothetical protein